MRNLKLLIVGLVLMLPGIAAADASGIPGTATWYLHVDLEKMRSEEAGKAVYSWLRDEVLTELKEEAGVDIDKELDRLTAYSLAGQGPVFLFDGNISQQSRDMLMTAIAARGDLQPKTSSGKSYYQLGQGDAEDGRASIGNDNIELQIEALAEESWISLDLKNKVVVTASEAQMKDMLSKGGKIAGSRSHKDAMLIITAEKALLQAGMNSSALGEEDDGKSDWNSNILRNTKQIAFLVAAVADKLAIEAKLITIEPQMAQSLASVVRGLISLVSFNDEMDAEAVAMLQGTKVEAKGNTLSISLAVDPKLLVSTLSD